MRSGFRLTYINISIVVIVIGLGAKLIKPQFSEASEETKISQLIDGLEVMRTHIDLYRVGHGAIDCCDSFEQFEHAIITKTKGYGAHMKQIPTNPFNELNTVRFDGEPAGVGPAGWRFDTKRGLFQADDSAAHAEL